jgi:Holliday junction DNA helicase RuvA
MIAHINGQLIEKTPTYVVIDCGGVGYQLHISLNTFARLPDTGTVKLLSHLSIKEDAHVLFGFWDEQERGLFRLLISVNGVGPGTARMILSSLTPGELQTAILSGQVAVLKGVKGIGEKTAQRILIDLKDKVGKSEQAPTAFSTLLAHNKVKEEALSALVMLGFARNLAEKAVEKVLKTAGGEEPQVEQLIKQALKNL